MNYPSDTEFPKWGCGKPAPALQFSRFLKLSNSESFMKKFLLSDRFFGILITLFVLGSYVTGSALLDSVELKFYDVRAKFREDTAQKPNEVAIVAADRDLCQCVSLL